MKRYIALCIISAGLILLSVSCGQGKKNKNQSDKTVATTSSITDRKSESTKEIPDKAHNSRNSLDIEGVYEGILPCADCNGIKTKLVLIDHGYRLGVIYLGKSGKNRAQYEGKYLWFGNDNKIRLVGIEKPNTYEVGENVLYALDMDSNRIKGKYADLYILTKTKSLNN